MQNFDIKRNARKCCQTEKAFRPGESFYSELIETEDGSLLRRDYAADQWKGMSNNSIGWWKQIVPELESGKIYWAPDEVLISYFKSLAAQPSQADAAFVMSLLMVQKKLLTMEETSNDQSKQVLRNRKSGEVFEIEQQIITPERIGELEQQLCENLFSDQPVTPDNDDQ